MATDGDRSRSPSPPAPYDADPETDHPSLAAEPSSAAAAAAAAAESPPKHSHSFSHSSTHYVSSSSSTHSSSSDLGPAPHRPRRSTDLDVKPISTLPMDDSPPNPTPLPPVPTARSRRPRSAVLATAASSRPRAARVWSTDDELTILRGLATFRTRHHGALPSSATEIDRLHASIRGSLSVKASTNQLSDKVRRLKQKYASLVTKAKKEAEPSFATPHDQSIYDLGGKVWGVIGVASGGENNGGDSDREESVDGFAEAEDTKSRKKRKLNVVTTNGNRGGEEGFLFAEENDKEAYPFLWEAVEKLAKEGDSGAAFSRGFKAIDRPKARSMEEKLRKFSTAEVRQQLRRMDLMRETAKLLLDAIERLD